MICIFTIFIALSCKKTYMGYLIEEFPKLIKKRLMSSKVLPILHRIPNITPPILIVINFVRFIWRINGNNILSGEITLPFVEFTFISKQEPSSLPFLRAEGRRRDSIFYSVENRTYLLIKIQI